MTEPALGPAAGVGPVPRVAHAAPAPRRVSPVGRPKPWLYAGLRVVGGALLRLILDVRVSGAEHVPASGPVIVAGNHRGVVDGPVVALFVARPMAFVAKAELFVGPAARILTWLGQIPVHRGRPDRAALRRALDVLAADGVLGLFPEGTRGAGALDEVQHGIAYIALRSPGCVIVPVACLGTERALPQGSFVPRVRARVDVVFGPPLRIRPHGDPRSRRVVAETAEQIRAVLAAHVRDAEGARRAQTGAASGTDLP